MMIDLYPLLQNQSLKNRFTRLINRIEEKLSTNQEDSEDDDDLQNDSSMEH